MKSASGTTPRPQREESKQRLRKGKDTAGTSTRHKTYLRLKEMILIGELRPSQHIVEGRLADDLGVSRTPLREALMKLEEEGLVVGQRNIGYEVVDLDIKTVRDLLVVREALDVCAAQLACSVASEDDLNRIADLMVKMRELHNAAKSKPSDAARDLELGLQIHEVIAQATRNDALIKVSSQIYQKLRLALWLEVLWVEWKNVGLDEHEAIAAAILARDPVAAAEAARAHVRSSLKNMAKVEEMYHYRRRRR